MQKKVTSNGKDKTKLNNFIEDIDILDTEKSVQPEDTNNDSDITKRWCISSNTDEQANFQDQINLLGSQALSTKLDVENLKTDVSSINAHLLKERITTLKTPTTIKEETASTPLPKLIDFGNTWKKFKIVAFLLAAFFLYFLVRSPAHSAVQPESHANNSANKKLDKLNFIGSAGTNKETTSNSPVRIESESDNSIPFSSESPAYVMNDGSAYQISYYLLLITNDHKPLFNNEQRGSIDTIIRYLALKQNWQVATLNVWPDQIEVFVAVPPTVAPESMVRIFKKQLNRALLKQYPMLANTRQHGSIWDDSYCLATNQSIYETMAGEYLEQWPVSK